MSKSCVASTSRPCLALSRSTRLTSRALPVRSRTAISKQKFFVTKATAEEKVGVQEAPLTQSKEEEVVVANWVPVCRPEDLPKGVRKEVEVEGRSILLFWYRNQIYAIQSRSPAEGGYSEGFIRAKLTQDYCIECPSTGSLFSLKDGLITSWYPNNPVLRALTPADLCKPLEIYPVKLAQDALYVDASRGTAFAGSRGGAGTSLENNNVFTVQPTVYFEGMDPTKETASVYADVAPTGAINPAVAIATTVGIGAVAVSGTALAIYNENVIALGVFWVVLGGIVGVLGYNYVNSKSKPT